MSLGWIRSTKTSSIFRTLLLVTLLNIFFSSLCDFAGLQMTLFVAND